MSGDDRSSGKLLKLLTTFLTIFGGIATIMACVIAFLALVAPKPTFEVIVSQFSGNTPTPVIITVVVTPSPLPGTSTNTPQPTSTPEPTATNTPIPTATPISTTAPGTVLEPGQTWYEDGLALRMDVLGIKPDSLVVYITLRNLSENPLLAEVGLERFRMMTNLGDGNISYLHSMTTPRGGISLEPGEDITLTEDGFFPANLAMSEVKYVIVEVIDLSRIEKAQWRVDIPH